MDGASSSHQPAPGPRALARIIPAADLAAWKSGKDLLRSALLETQHTLSAARVAAEQASAEGYREGYAKGLAQAKASCASTLVALEAQRALGWRRLQPAIGRSLAACFARLVGSVSMPEHLHGRLKTILEDARPKGTVCVRAHSSSIDAVRQAVQAVEMQFPGIELFRVVADDTLGADDLVVETRAGIVDGRLDSQVAAIARGLGDAVASFAVDSPAARAGAA